MSLIKQTNSTKHMAHMCFQIYNQEPKFCVVSHLTEYLKRAKRYKDTDKLFLTCIKPYKVASKDIISTWCKSIIKESGISIHRYTSRSSRAAASLSTIIKTICFRKIKLYKIFLKAYLYKVLI